MIKEGRGSIKRIISWGSVSVSKIEFAIVPVCVEGIMTYLSNG